jgi:hypothetical protein
MTIDADKTVELHAEEAAIEDPIDATDFIDLMERVNATVELIKDAACPGAGAATYRGHDHSSAGLGRGIPRSVCGGFLIMGPPVAYTFNSDTPTSLGYGASAGSYPASSAPTALNYIMGIAYVSPNLSEIRIAVQAKCSSEDHAPQIRIKNLTDTTGTTENSIVASNWIDLTTDQKWYGDGDSLVRVPVIPSTSQKRIELDIEGRTQVNAGVNREIEVAAAYPYETLPQK